MNLLALVTTVYLAWMLKKTECINTTSTYFNNSLDGDSTLTMLENVTRDMKNVSGTPLNKSEAFSDNYMERVYSYWFYVGGVCCTIFSGFGIIGNILSIVVLATPDMKSSTSVYLILLAVFDTGLLLSNFLFTSMRWLMTYSPNKMSFTFHFSFPSLPIFYAVTSITHTGSVYTTIAVNVERYVAVCHPLKAASFCTISRAKKASVLLVLISLVYNIPRYLEMYWDWKHMPYFNQTLIVVVLSDMAYSYEYQTIYLVYINFICKVILPVVSLVILNGIMIQKLYRIKPNLDKQVKNNSVKERFTVMVVAVVVVFMVSLTMACTELIFFHINSAITLGECSEVCGYVSGASQLAVVINSAINFVLFCFFGHKFRAVFLKKFGCYRRRMANGKSVHTATTGMQMLSSARY